MRDPRRRCRRLGPDDFGQRDGGPARRPRPTRRCRSRCALALAKLAATAATLRVGVPGGVFSPSLAVSAGWALLAFIGLDALGFDLPGARWDGMIAAMAVGIAVGLGSPLLAAVVVPEMVGSVSLLPVCALVSFAAWYGRSPRRRMAVMALATARTEAARRRRLKRWPRGRRAVSRSLSVE